MVPLARLFVRLAGWPAWRLVAAAAAAFATRRRVQREVQQEVQQEVHQREMRRDLQREMRRGMQRRMQSERFGHLLWFVVDSLCMRYARKEQLVVYIICERYRVPRRAHSALV